MGNWKPVLLSFFLGICLLNPSASEAATRDDSGLSKDQFLRQLAGASRGEPVERMRALAAALPAREKALDRRRREDVIAEVEQRTRQLKVTAPSTELADLLLRYVRLDLALDHCRTSGESDCSRQASAVQALEARFRALSGFSVEEFQQGRPLPKAPPLAKENFFPDHCTCSFYVYSSNRWMSGSWGLECNGHASHGVCSNNVDSAHSSGTGGMVGAIYISFSTSRSIAGCPDDQRTCFKGPSLDHLGEWGNVCNCDTWHSQYYDPTSSWYGGDLQDSEEVYQGSGGGVVDGSCEGLNVGIEEAIQEHDPGCCDDPMGSLLVSLPIGEGTGSVSAPASAQNCNGGSQSGVPPYCGNFGATIRVIYSCQTEPDTPTSCQGRCFSDPPEGDCSCRAGCMGQGNCCGDYTEVCCDTNPWYSGCWS